MNSCWQVTAAQDQLTLNVVLLSFCFENRCKKCFPVVFSVTCLGLNFDEKKTFSCFLACSVDKNARDEVPFHYHFTLFFTLPFSQRIVFCKFVPFMRRKRYFVRFSIISTFCFKIFILSSSSRIPCCPLFVERLYPENHVTMCT